MRKQVFGRKFKRTMNQRTALFNGLISAVISKGSIETTEEKAKAIKGDLEKLVTKAKKGEAGRRLLQPNLKPFEIDKMINEIAPGFANRQGGYTRIIKTGSRFNDNASMVILQWVEREEVVAVPKEIKNKKSNLKSENNEAKAAIKKDTKKSTVVKAKADKPAKKGSK